MSVAAPVRHALTRHTALESARLLYSELVDKALTAEGADVDYLRTVAHDSDARLDGLMRYRSDVTLPEHAQATFEFLRRSILDPADSDALMRWVETFPDAVADLFPPSGATFWVVPDGSRAETHSSAKASQPAA